MKALVVTKFGRPAEMSVEEVPEPAVGAGEALVRIKASAINPVDLLISAGALPNVKQPPLILGFEATGEVVSSSRFPYGARVLIQGHMLGMAADGTDRDMIAISEESLIPLPEAFSFEEGASFASAYLTAYCAITGPGQVQEGDWVAISGATGSVGHAAVRVAALLGARPIAIVSNSDKAALAADLGADEIVDLSQEDLVQRLAEITGGHGVDVAIDPVGGTVTSTLADTLKNGGRLLVIGWIGGTESTVNLQSLIGKQTMILGFNLFYSDQKDIRDAFGRLMAWAEEGKVHPLVDRTFALEEHAQAFSYLVSRQAKGKILFRL